MKYMLHLNSVNYLDSIKLKDCGGTCNNVNHVLDAIMFTSKTSVCMNERKKINSHKASKSPELVNIFVNTVKRANNKLKKLVTIRTKVNKHGKTQQKISLLTRSNENINFNFKRGDVKC